MVNVAIIYIYDAKNREYLNRMYKDRFGEEIDPIKLLIKASKQYTGVSCDFLSVLLVNKYGLNMERIEKEICKYENEFTSKNIIYFTKAYINANKLYDPSKLRHRFEYFRGNLYIYNECLLSASVKYDIYHVEKYVDMFYKGLNFFSPKYSRIKDISKEFYDGFGLYD